jgi:hypothetical protein
MWVLCMGRTPCDNLILSQDYGIVVIGVLIVLEVYSHGHYSFWTIHGNQNFRHLSAHMQALYVNRFGTGGTHSLVRSRAQSRLITRLST